MRFSFLTDPRVSVVTGACVGHLETDGVENDLDDCGEAGPEAVEALLDAARPVLA
jgi:hypothetical protein